MEIKEITSKQEWEGFLQNCEEKTFLQSWNWGQFQISMNKKVWRFGIYQDDQLVSVALVIKMTARRGSFLLVPHGPIVEFKHEILKAFILKTVKTKLLELAKEENADFLRISPIWQRTPKNEELFKELGFRLRPLHKNPESS